ncbi:MAG: NADH:flavin oxidoreductase/NADH oxidase [Xanthobacteraceae bacterium]|nr:NADH:flavin oxidoreductase/NADH oxidase [Xanthobacteraceae bacterium]
MSENERRILKRDSHPYLLRPIRFRSIEAPNRIMLSPMCQYCATDGMPDDWHMVHLGSRAVGGVGIVFTEAVHSEPRGRITKYCLGLWNEQQRDAFARIAKFVRAQGAVAGIQIGHAGRKASTMRPWERSLPLPAEQGGWDVIGPSALAFAKGFPTPAAMDEKEIETVTASMATSARYARQAGFQVIEVHAAHGYLLHQFCSPLSNQRTDGYGGSFENRIRLLMETLDAVRTEWPNDLALFLRLSVSDHVEGGWDLPQSIELCRRIKARGDVDLIDCSSGGNDPRQSIAIHPGYQVPFAEAVRRETGLPTAAVGLIHSADMAEQILANGQADLVVLGRTLMSEPYWPLKAARALRADARWPIQYERSNIF